MTRRLRRATAEFGPVVPLGERSRGGIAPAAVVTGVIALIDWWLPGSGTAGALAAIGVVLAPVAAGGAVVAVRVFRSAGSPIDHADPDSAGAAEPGDVARPAGQASAEAPWPAT